MNCDKCEKDMELVEHYKRGRRYWSVFFCQSCNIKKLEKGGLVPYNRPKGTLAKSCIVPWGKQKRVRRLHKSKKRR